MTDIKTIKLNETEKRFVWEVLNGVAQTNQKIIDQLGDGFKHEQLKENSKTACFRLLMAIRKQLPMLQPRRWVSRLRFLMLAWLLMPQANASRME